jgi:hypothetical protein
MKRIGHRFANDALFMASPFETYAPVSGMTTQMIGCDDATGTASPRRRRQSDDPGAAGVAKGGTARVVRVNGSIAKSDACAAARNANNM